MREWEPPAKKRSYNFFEREKNRHKLQIRVENMVKETQGWIETVRNENSTTSQVMGQRFAIVEDLSRNLQLQINELRGKLLVIEPQIAIACHPIESSNLRVDLEKLKKKVHEIVEFVRYMDGKVGEMSRISMERDNNIFKRNDGNSRNYSQKNLKVIFPSVIHHAPRSERN